MGAKRSNGSIPVIDISEVSAADAADQLVDAVARYGFVFVRAMNFGEFSNGKAQQPLPSSLASHEAELNHFGVLCHELCINLLRLLAVGLKVDLSEGGKDWFSSRHDPSQGPSGSILRLLHYPAIEMDKSDLDTSVDIRAGAHSDYGSLTLLFQRASQSGLEILTPNLSWSPVPVHPPSTEDDPFPPILVNVGDLMQFWTNGLLRSTVHRVVFPEGKSEDRYSIAYFCHPLDYIEIKAVPSAMICDRKMDNSQQGMETVTAEGYLRKRLAETYGWGKQQSPARD
ncbi:MAG: hypothetical protein Q9175_000372 [Cornicularia normoerica]